MLPTRDTTAAPPRTGIVLSIGFWMALFGSAVLFAAATLSPRWLTRVTLERELHRQQVDLLFVQQEVRHRELMCESLERGDRPRPAMTLRGRAENRIEIPLSPQLQHRSGITPAEPIVDVRVDPWYLPLIEAVDASPSLRRLLLLASLTLLSFGFIALNNQGGPRFVGRLLTSPLRLAGTRYRQSTSPAPS